MIHRQRKKWLKWCWHICRLTARFSLKGTELKWKQDINYLRKKFGKVSYKLAAMAASLDNVWNKHLGTLYDHNHNSSIHRKLTLLRYDYICSSQTSDMGWFWIFWMGFSNMIKATLPGLSYRRCIVTFAFNVPDMTWVGIGRPGGRYDLYCQSQHSPWLPLPLGPERRKSQHTQNKVCMKSPIELLLA